MEATATRVVPNGSSTEQLREKATQVRQDIRDLSVAAKEVATEKFDHWYKEGREKAIRLEKGLENQIREHPLQAVMIAAGAGFLAGYLVSRRR
jgi:ElaB/YqjD/DUF883 family membrane-anchored ribosome-binding protein